MQDQIELNDLFTVDQLAAEHPEFLSVPTLRWQLRDRDSNGLQSACVKIGKKLLISKTRYQAWLAQKSQSASA